jgi:DNA polymerase-4
MRLRSYALIAGNVHVRVKYRNDSVWRADQAVDPTSDTLVFLHALDRLWEQRPRNKVPPLAVGVALTALDAAAHRSHDLFAAPRDHERLDAAMDAINLRYGKNSLYFGGAHRALAAAPMRIAFQHIPDLATEAD